MVFGGAGFSLRTDFSLSFEGLVSVLGGTSLDLLLKDLGLGGTGPRRDWSLSFEGLVSVF